jgi:hypothetical protein
MDAHLRTIRPHLSAARPGALSRACLPAGLGRGLRRAHAVLHRAPRRRDRRDGFLDGARLCGRHWGSVADDELLHFELCYYHGIDYAIRHRLAVFDAGVQGEHKLLRGFDPVTVPSFHHYAHAGFARAIADYYAEERAQVAAQCRALAAHSAYRQDG